MATVLAPLAGEIAPLDAVADDVFAQRIMGDGVALHPHDARATAPLDGVIAKLFPGGHAFVVQSDEGVDVLVHLGLDTVHRAGAGFTTHVEEGERIAAGEVVVTVDLETLRADGVDVTTPVVVISDHAIAWRAEGAVEGGAPLLALRV